jgi:hypothetical protein
VRCNGEALPGVLQPGDLAVWDGHVAMVVDNGMTIGPMHQYGCRTTVVLALPRPTPTGTNGMVLQRHRRTEHGHDPVAGELVRRAAVPLYNCGDVHRVDHIGEENRDLLVLRLGITVFDW